jgi:hypothetical protein
MYMFSHLQWAGAINAGTWDILFVLQLLLALNRLSVILKNIFLISIKGRELPWERRLFNVGIFSEENHFILIASISAASTALHVGPFPLSNPPPNFLIFPPSAEGCSAWLLWRYSQAHIVDSTSTTRNSTGVTAANIDGRWPSATLSSRPPASCR